MNSASSKDTLETLNGLTEGFASIARAFAPFIAGFLWGDFAGVEYTLSPQKWPLGPYLTGNDFGIICMSALWGLLVTKPKK